MKDEHVNAECGIRSTEWEFVHLYSLLFSQIDRGCARKLWAEFWGLGELRREVCG